MRLPLLALKSFFLDSEDGKLGKPTRHAPPVRAYGVNRRWKTHW
jgi:hypothetical protein